jgi:hypothetical protein
MRLLIVLPCLLLGCERPQHPDHIQYFDAVHQQMSVISSLRSRAARAEQHCNQWFAEDGSIESVSFDGRWLVSRDTNDMIAYTAIYPNGIAYDGGFMMVTPGSTRLVTSELYDVIFNQTNLRTGMRADSDVYIDFVPRHMIGPTDERKTNVIDYFSFGL